MTDFVRHTRRFARLLPVMLASCVELPHPKQATTLVPERIVAPDLTLESGCTPSGVERCFDALDDNCNGVIDEGCGLQTGALQFAIAWSDRVDVDLLVSGPDGAIARQTEPSESGLLKDRDCKGTTDCHGQNVENVFLADGWPRRGTYRVIVRLDDPRTATLPIRVRLSARVGQRVLTTVTTLDARGAERAFEFSL